MIVEGHTNICSSHFKKKYITLYGILFCKIFVENIIYDEPLIILMYLFSYDQWQ